MASLLHYELNKLSPRTKYTYLRRKDRDQNENSTSPIHCASSNESDKIPRVPKSTRNGKLKIVKYIALQMRTPC